MVRKTISILTFLIISLAAVGLVSKLFTDTANFLFTILIVIGSSAAIFAVFYFVFLRNRTPSNDMKKYKKAVRQSKAKYKSDNIRNTKVLTKKQPDLIRKKRNKRTATHLRVIEGNKSKRKDRASL
ncbi:SA1362 family protein [Oceanobacillus chungangensis]|uniref:Uncharacterized protein n=1 Tax=Oceanobacillus chungangensis TaxID=1229152 RepID=A0A3D8Q0H2_9BACI|nr:SA1362 family protein [Oceanobacillus chungangensis]RDW21950.1 hypothetical protein CWR45_00220 [Oceanobacillus chungangensis]